MTLLAYPEDSSTGTGRSRHSAGKSLWFHATSVGLAVFVLLTSVAALYLFRIFCGTWAGELMFALVALAWLYLLREFLAELLAMNLSDC